MGLKDFIGGLVLIYCTLLFLIITVGLDVSQPRHISSLNDLKHLDQNITDGWKNMSQHCAKGFLPCLAFIPAAMILICFSFFNVMFVYPAVPVIELLLSFKH